MASFLKHKDHAVPTAAANEPTEAQINAAQAQDAAEQAAVNARLMQNEAAGARVLEFDENATPEEKAAQAAKLKVASLTKPPATSSSAKNHLASGATKLNLPAPTPVLRLPK